MNRKLAHLQMRAEGKNELTNLNSKHPTKKKALPSF